MVSSILDMLTFALCLPFSETTDSRHFDALLQMVAIRAKTLFKHFQVSFFFFKGGLKALPSALIVLQIVQVQKVCSVSQSLAPCFYYLKDNFMLHVLNPHLLLALCSNLL